VPIFLKHSVQRVLGFNSYSVMDIRKILYNILPPWYWPRGCAVKLCYLFLSGFNIGWKELWQHIALYLKRSLPV